MILWVAYCRAALGSIWYSEAHRVQPDYQVAHEVEQLPHIIRNCSHPELCRVRQFHT